MMSLAISIVSGCGKTDANGNKTNIESAAGVDNGSLSNDSCVLSVGSTKVTYSEYMIYAYILKSQYESTFTEDVWTYSLGNGSTIGMEALEEIVRLITEIKVMQKEATSQKISLAIEEKDDVTTRTTEFMKKIPADYVKQYGITQNLVNQVFSDNELARKMYDIVTGKLSDTITDESARQAKIQYLYLSTKGMEAAEKTAVKTKADGLLKKAKKAKKFEVFAQEHTEAGQVEMNVDSSYAQQAIATAALALGKKQMSGVVEAEDGYYILYCLSPNDQEATKLKKEQLLREGQDKLFSDTYNEWMKKYKVKVSTSLSDAK